MKKETERETEIGCLESEYNSFSTYEENWRKKAYCRLNKRWDYWDDSSRSLEMTIKNNLKKGIIFYTIQEFAQFFSLESYQVYYLIQNYYIDAIKLRHFLRIGYAEILNFLEINKEYLI